MSKKKPSKSGTSASSDETTAPPFETRELCRLLADFLNQRVIDPITKLPQRVGDYHRRGVYAFFDYDGEPIYVGQANEKLRSRIRRHLTNQRTDAVAMNVLDPFEVFEIAVWPLPQYQTVGPGDRKGFARERDASLGEGTGCTRTGSPPTVNAPVRTHRRHVHTKTRYDILAFRAKP